MTDEVETTISMQSELRQEVLAGERTSAKRPGHRNFQVGPASIRFLREGNHGPYWTADKPVDVWITEVRHLIAEDKFAVFMHFLHEQGQSDESQGRITEIHWILV